MNFENFKYYAFPGSVPVIQVADGEKPDRFYRLLTRNEKLTIIHSFGLSRGKRGVSSSEIEALLEWVETIRLFERMIAKVLKGELRIDVRNDHPVFIEPSSNPGDIS